MKIEERHRKAASGRILGFLRSIATGDVRRNRGSPTESAQIIADCEEEERNDGSPVAAGAKGSNRLDCVAGFNPNCPDGHINFDAETLNPEASSDPLAVAVRMEQSRSWLNWSLVSETDA